MAFDDSFLLNFYADWDESSFKKLRKDSLERIRAIAHTFPFATANDSDEFPGLILVDDIMYLRSMRREVYVIARDSNIPIIVVWVNTPLEVALERNSQRSGKQRIEEQTITKIHAALEPPDSQHICDRVHIIIDGSCEDRCLYFAIPCQEVQLNSTTYFIFVNTA